MDTSVQQIVDQAFHTVTHPEYGTVMRMLDAEGPLHHQPGRLGGSSLAGLLPACSSDSMMNIAMPVVKHPQEARPGSASRCHSFTPMIVQYSQTSVHRSLHLG